MCTYVYLLVKSPLKNGTESRAQRIAYIHMHNTAERMQVFVPPCMTKYSKQQKVEKGTSKNKNKRDAAAAAKREPERESPIALLLSSSPLLFFFGE